MPQFLSPEELRAILPTLANVHPFFGMSFLAFKRAELPIGESRNVIFMNMAEDFLREYYKPSSHYDGYYNPFTSSKPQKRWVRPRYPSTSLQRITADTFGNCFIHRKESSSWAWHPDYVNRLSRRLGELRRGKLPMLEMALWLFRDAPMSTRRPAEQYTDRFIESFRITPTEIDRLFELPRRPLAVNMRSRTLSEDELLEILGPPPGTTQHRGSVLRRLSISRVGPSHQIEYKPGDRLNIVTGDNSLGKTFLLDCMWWILTGSWLGDMAFPSHVSPRGAAIQADLSAHGRPATLLSGKYDHERALWKRDARTDVGTPLTIYARFDGSCAIRDSIRQALYGDDHPLSDPLIFTRDEIWNGKIAQGSSTRDHWVCNGLVRDWANWHIGRSHYAKQYDRFLSALQRLSPSENDPLAPGDLIRLPGDSREIPTLSMPYGLVPVVHASAGVRRIIGLAYLLVWAWHEHLEACRATDRSVDRRLILILDEVEAHLHPKWQRTIVPSLMQTIELLSYDLSPQVHLATHSPMVLASAETVFDINRDKLHHLFFASEGAKLEELPFVKMGRVDAWLTSESFGLQHARSLDAEMAIEAAKSLQLKDEPLSADVASVHNRLRNVLSPDDEFWSRWLYFAEQHGVSL